MMSWRLWNSNGISDFFVDPISRSKVGDVVGGSPFDIQLNMGLQNSCSIGGKGPRMHNYLWVPNHPTN